MSSCSVRSRISSSRLFEYFSSIWNIVSTMFTFRPWFSFLNKSWTALKSGLSSGCSAQHCLMILMASGGAAPLLTEGRISGGGLLTFSIISEMQVQVFCWYGRYAIITFGSQCKHTKRLSTHYYLLTDDSEGVNVSRLRPFLTEAGMPQKFGWSPQQILKK